MKHSETNFPAENEPEYQVFLKRPSHGKLKLTNSCWQTEVGVCERHKNSRQTRFYLTPTVCKRVCRLFCAVHTRQLGFANTSLPTQVCRVKAALATPTLLLRKVRYSGYFHIKKILLGMFLHVFHWSREIITE